MNNPPNTTKPEDKGKHIFSNCVFAAKTIFQYAPAVSTVYTITALTAGFLTPVGIYCLQRLIDCLSAYVTLGADIGQAALWGGLYVFSLAAVPMFWRIQPHLERTGQMVCMIL
ncbi:MAG: hypothetical protein FWH48_07445 [Oscillospiraceae bacterium]|nr:hypothetical protein [Oscillospiraceae bacterium]